MEGYWEDNGEPRIFSGYQLRPLVYKLKNCNWRARRGPRRKRNRSGAKVRECKKCSQRIRGGFWSVNHGAKVMTISRQLQSART